MLLLLKTSSKSRKSSRKSSRKHKSRRHHKISHHRGQFQQPTPIGFAQPMLGRPMARVVMPQPMIGHLPQPFALPQPMRGSRKSKKNLKNDVQNLLEKVRKVNSNKKVQKYKKLLDECITTNCTGLEDKKEQQSCSKTNCRKELKKYNKRFMKEYNRIE